MTKTNDNLVAGSICALVTPFTAEGRALDEAAWVAQISHHVDAGTAGLVVAGTTGESATLSAGERDRMLELALAAAAGRCRILVGTGAAGTDATIEQTRRAAACGADAVLVVTPYYNRPPQRGLAAHFRAVADASAVPVVLYNVPSRTACDLLPETVAELAAHPNIAAIKESVADMQRVRSHRAAGLAVASGDDPSALAALAAGASGVISVAANIVPRQFARLCRAAVERRMDAAEVLDRQLQPLYRFLALESNPIGVKWLLAAAGRMRPTLRLPLVELDAKHHEEGRALLARILADEEAAEHDV
ncbi:MAG: 4-hydroxy-tetrahydrodipicolinate synthase [Wenzhouxiangellaceae bacterium]|nr:4-hydroxy-tetrahydrodipicolinate synthase [Wenzhouxiangellaceae bacterium]